MVFGSLSSPSRAHRGRARVAALVAGGGVAAVAVSVALSGCAAADLRADVRADEHTEARARVADVARRLYRTGTDTIEDYVRWAHADTTNGSVQLVGYEAYADVEHGEPLGVLQFRTQVQLTQNGEPYVACFESEFDFWGSTAARSGRYDDDAAIARDIECPPDAGPIVPPEDTRTVRVVPDGAEQIVVEVLGTASPEASADEVLAQIVERMPRPAGEREIAFEPDVLLGDGAIGVAMGDASDCLLVKRDADGVAVLSVPSIKLQPGELGCDAETALAPAELLRSPH